MHAAAHVAWKREVLCADRRRRGSLRGTMVSEAYASTLDLSFDVPAGLLVRQAHH